MRKRIRAMAEGKFDYREIEVQVSESRIERMAKKNEVLKGSITLESHDERKLKGLIYTTDRRMVCEDIQFVGSNIQIIYEFNTKGMEEGDTNKGEIYIESNAGEIIVPYVVSISYHYVDSSIGKVRNLFHFANLAQQNYQEAYKLFCSKKFRLIEMEEFQRHLYEALIQSNVCRENMEEFLIAVHKKQPIYFKLNANEESYICEGDSFKKEVMLSKNTWGHCTIHISADMDFIYIEKPVITAEDFVGNHYGWEFIVDRKKLHRGRNSARITFSSGIQKETLNVEIVLPSEKHKDYRKENQWCLELCDLYIQVRFHKIKDSVWVKEALGRAESLHALVPDKKFYMFFLAQMYAMAKREKEGRWIMDKIRDLPVLKDKEPELYAYYQYVNAMLKKDEEFTRLVKQEIQEMSVSYMQSFPLLVVRFFMDKELEENRLLKYRMLKQHFIYGCRSPFLYLEACLLLQRDLSLFNRLEAFEQHILSFSVRHEIVDAELVRKVSDLAMNLKQYEPIVFRFLTYAYEKFPLKECVEAICGMLIRSNKRNAKYFPWFERGVEAELKLTQLFEYYLYTISFDRKEMLPKTLLLYFNFESSLDYKRKAYLYANVWRYRELLGDLSASYEPRIRVFVMDQLRHRHINEELAYLYQQLSSDILGDEESSAYLEELVFVHKLTCDNPNVRQVVVRHGELDKEEIFPVVDKRAWMKQYHSSALVLLEDKSGIRHLDTIPYELEPLFPMGKITQYCLKFEKVKLGLLLNRYNKSKALMKEGTCGICEKLLQKAEVSLEFKQFMIRQLIEYYIERYEYEKAEEYLLQLRFGKMQGKERAHFLEIMITRGMYERAYELIMKYGPEHVAPKRLVRLCSRMIVIDEVQEELLGLCYYVFSKGKYDELVLEYLTRYFYGPTWQMDKLWRAAKQFDVETYQIGERILIQMLFTGYLLPDSGEVFEDYYRPGSKQEIVQAYLAFFAYYYVVHDQIIDQRVLQWIENEYRRGEKVSQDCQSALLKYYAEMQSIPEEKVAFLQEIMEKFIGKNMVFPFFSKMNGSVSNMFHMSEKTIIEHRANPDKRVFLIYRMGDCERDGRDFRKEEMDCIYDSIFVKELTTFYGERIQYYITERDQNSIDEKIVSSAIIENRHDSGDEGEGRFQMLNEIAVSRVLGDEETLQELMMKYSQTELLAEELFKLQE